MVTMKWCNTASGSYVYTRIYIIIICINERTSVCSIDLEHGKRVDINVSQIFSGNFGVVYKGFLKQDEEVLDVAVKTIKSELLMYQL